MNEHGYWEVYLALLYALLLFNVGWSLNICGLELGGLKRLKVRRDKSAQVSGGRSVTVSDENTLQESNGGVTAGDRSMMVAEVRASESPATGRFIHYCYK